MRAVVVAGAPFEATQLVQSTLRAAELLVAADTGADTLLRLGLRPQVVVGDMDSIDASLLERLRADGVEVIEHPVRKAKTDTHLAILEAIKRGATEVAIVGALGGRRLDHALANILLLGNDAFAAVDLRLVDGDVEVHVVRRSLRLAGKPGDFVTLLPLTDEARGVTTDGLEYALSDATLTRADSLGVSNELVGSEATVAVREGALLVAHQPRPRGDRHGPNEPAAPL